ncbi:putative zinc finger protein [Orchesella cincta]|uniref:Putative zinc finger protein n=1 Tax=Orchesella cincta TaxID=48709 RepID=A0A1D2MWM3_ORCCI|nr:putative zinc finger protein [Orchesella cincta]
MELRLSSTLGELGRLLKQPRENVPVHTDSSKVNVDGIRGFVAAKCLEKFKNVVIQKSGSDLKEKKQNREEEVVLPEENAEADCHKMDRWIRHTSCFRSGPEKDILEMEQKKKKMNLPMGHSQKPFLRRDSDKESEYGSDNDEKDWEPDSDASWDSKSKSSDDSNDDEHPHKKQRRQDICEAAKAVTATITSGMKVVFPCDECKRPFWNPDDLYFHLIWHEKQLGKQKATHYCYFCYKSFVLKQTLQVHMQRHTTIMMTGNPFKCDDKDCGASFENCRDLENHLATHTKPIHNCRFCKWGFLDAENLKFHQIVHTPHNNGYHCPSCTLITRNVKSLQAHYYRKHTNFGVGMKDFTCPECGRDYGCYETLKKHMKKTNHSYGDVGEPESLRHNLCPHCNERFYYKHLLITHIAEECDKNPEIKVLSCIRTKSRSGKLVKKVSCKVCGKFVRKCAMNNHLKQHLPEAEREQARAICDICGFSSRTETALKSHVHRMHKGKGTKKKRVQCQEKDCNKTFSCQEMLNHHLDTVHRGIDVSVVCDLCGKKLAYKSNLLWHKKTHAAEKIYGCHLCPKRFQDKGTLRKHLIREHGKTEGEEFTPGEGVVFKFVCMFPSCTSKFVTDIELQSHVGQRHSPPGGKFICPLCGKVFANQARLTRHNLVHSGEKAHACSVCSKSFAYRASLKDHLQAVHSIGGEEEYFSCKFQNCTAKFKIHKYLTKHLKRKHGFTVAPVERER